MGWAFAGGIAVGVIAVIAVLSIVRTGRRVRPAPDVPPRRAARASRPDGDPDGGQPDGPEDDPPGRGLGRRTVDALRVGVMVLDPLDRPVLVNPAAREMGLVRAAGAGRDAPAGATHQAAPHPVVRSLAGWARRSEVPREVELDLPQGAGRDPLGVHLTAVCLDERYVAVEAADVTEAHRVTRVRRDFVANVSHELKTPVGALQLLAEALLEATGTGGPDAVAMLDPQAARRFAERIRHESGRLGRLVSELIELSRLQGAEPLPQPVPVPVDQTVAEVLDRNRTAAAAKGIQLRYEGDRGLTVYGDDAQIATALGNLVENAVAYSPDTTDPSDPVQVVIGARSDGHDVDITVTDRGIGIALAELDRIFERFYRADRARSRATGGTGLGLAIVKHIATNHGGRVSVVSQPGFGSTFTLRLPARPRAGESGSVPLTTEEGSS